VLKSPFSFGAFYLNDFSLQTFMNDFLIERIGSREKLLFLISKFSGASLAYQSIFILYFLFFPN